MRINYDTKTDNKHVLQHTVMKLRVLPTVDQSWSVARIAAEACPSSWEDVFREAEHDLRFISSKLEEEERHHGPFFPEKKDLFNAFHLTALSEVKIVIIGQDPYPQSVNINGRVLPRATGLSFSVRPEDAVPVSLKNIYKELSSTVNGFVTPNHGDLREWAKQGVLMLNTCLTVRPGEADSHSKFELWHGFVSKVLKKIAQVNPTCIFFLWGKKAQALRRQMIGDRSVIFECCHPSGLSANGFFGCNHFNKANQELLKQKKTGIVWTLPPKQYLPYSHTPVIPLHITHPSQIAQDREEITQSKSYIVPSTYPTQQVQPGHLQFYDIRAQSAVPNIPSIPAVVFGGNTGGYIMPNNANISSGVNRFNISNGIDITNLGRYDVSPIP